QQQNYFDSYNNKKDSIAKNKKNVIVYGWVSTHPFSSITKLFQQSNNYHVGVGKRSPFRPTTFIEAAKSIQVIAYPLPKQGYVIQILYHHNVDYIILISTNFNDVLFPW
ncbi:MAG: hypothetical protein KBA03_05880, partial [Anaerolineaceae bacterium]|nr:hypothetical protein [Anaerolineaceae bacterium]